MEIGNNTIYNPAAVVENTSSRSSSSRGHGGSYTSDKGSDSVRGGGSEAVESKNRTISNVSRARAAAGNPNLSAETQEAIKNGALPPSVAETKIKSTAPEEVHGISNVSKQLASTGSIEANFAPESMPNLKSTAPVGSIVDIVI